MSGNSQNNSGSPQRGFFKRMLGQEPSRDAKPEIKQRHPGFAVSSEAAVTPGRTARPQEVIISPAVKQINKDGYVVYNTPEKQDVYVTIQPESAFFDDEEPVMKRMAGGSFVGGNKQPSAAAVPVRNEPEPEPIVYDQPADIFSNACRREVFEEIDFNEIIIKKNESFDTEFEEAPVFFKPSSGEVSDPIMEESFGMKSEPETASTSTGEVEAPKMSFMGYKEVPEYEVDEVPTEIKEAPAEVPITEVPAGLYVDGRRPIDTAEADAEGKEEPSSFVEMSAGTEMAMTSEAAPIEEVTVIPRLPDLLSVPAAAEENIPPVICETEVEDVSPTVADAPIEIVDDVADIMKLTIPELQMSEDMISELSKDIQRNIPEDGLEAHDCMFHLMGSPVKEESGPQAVSFGFEGKESAVDPKPSVNFRFGEPL